MMHNIYIYLILNADVRSGTGSREPWQNKSPHSPPCFSSWSPALPTRAGAGVQLQLQVQAAAGRQGGMLPRVQPSMYNIVPAYQRGLPLYGLSGPGDPAHGVLYCTDLCC